MQEHMTYAGVGVDYDAMDPFKRMAQKAAHSTEEAITRFGFRIVSWSRGESAFLVELPDMYIGFVVEGLGTKSLVADAMELAELAQTVESLTKKSFYDRIAQCNVAMAVNDLATLGVLPVCYGQYVAVGDSAWFKDSERAKALVEGTRQACLLAGCAWGVGLVEDLLNAGVDIHYAVNITGHGWRKLMRAPQPFAYVIEYLPETLPIFDFMQEHGPICDEEAYGNFNMGAGFALYVPEAHVQRVWSVLYAYPRSNPYPAVYAGYVERSKEKKVVIHPKGLEFRADTLGVR